MAQAEKETKESLKIKKKPGRLKKLSSQEDKTKTTIDLKPKEKTVQKETTTKVNVEPTEKIEEIIKEKVEDKKEEKEVTVIQEKPIVKEEKKPEPISQKRQLPDSVQKLVNFMTDTGGNVEDYVTLNKDYSKYDDKLLVKEYYKKTRPHLEDEEINFLMEDNFTYDEEADEERFVRKQKLAYKEEVAKAKNFLEQMKGKYYDEIKLRPSVTNEQKKAMDFFQRYSEEQQQITEARSEFVNNTKDFFQEKFKGFEFNIGDKAFRYSVSNPQEMINAQTDVSKIITKYSDDSGKISDMDGYHKAIYAARNADRLAEHFYEQGKADAIKDVMAKSKNINSDPRPISEGSSLSNGWKVKAVTGVDASKLKIKKKT
tara:strand:- start:678 stop:1790 length:1113 start_codon:yes stop_codon:yes gene_type:complete